MSKIILYHAPKTGGTSLANQISGIMRDRNLRSCLLNPEVPEGEIRFTDSTKNSYLIGYCHQHTIDQPGRMVSIKDAHLNHYRAASFISGHIHSSILFASAFANSILFEHSCANAIVNNWGASKCVAILTYRDPNSWLRSVLNFSFQAKIKKKFDGFNDFSNWLNLCEILEHGNDARQRDFYLIKKQTVSVLIDFKDAGYFTSQAQMCRNYLDSINYVGANLYNYSLETRDLGKACEALGTRFKAHDNSGESVWLNKTKTDQFPDVANTFSRIIEDLDQRERDALDLDVSIYNQFPQLLRSPEFFDQFSHVLTSGMLY